MEWKYSSSVIIIYQSLSYDAIFSKNWWSVTYCFVFSIYNTHANPRIKWMNWINEWIMMMEWMNGQNKTTITSITLFYKCASQPLIKGLYHSYIITPLGQRYHKSIPFVMITNMIRFTHKSYKHCPKTANLGSKFQNSDFGGHVSFPDNMGQDPKYWFLKWRVSVYRYLKNLLILSIFVL